MTNSSNKSEICQTVIKEKVEKLSLLDGTNLLIVLYSNIKEDTNAIEQVKSLHNCLKDYLSLNKNSLEWSKNHLKQHGFSAIEMNEMLGFQENVNDS